MLDLTTIVAVSIIGTAAAPLNRLQDFKVLDNSVHTQVAIREIAPETILKPSLICTGCDQLKFTPYPAYIITPERKALLNTIRFAEGTWNNGLDDGYKILFGGRMVSSLEKHPNKIQYSYNYASAAAGAYQFLPGTWQEASKKLNLNSFYPDNQDQAALYLIEKRNALKLADLGKMTPELAAKLAPEWASFPTLNGNSYYGQPVKKFSELKKFYEDNLASVKGVNQ